MVKDQGMVGDSQFECPDHPPRTGLQVPLPTLCPRRRVIDDPESGNMVFVSQSSGGPLSGPSNGLSTGSSTGPPPGLSGDSLPDAFSVPAEAESVISDDWPPNSKFLDRKAVKNSLVQNFFDKIGSNTPCVFLCIGPPENSRIVQVKVKDADGDNDVFRAMQAAWRKIRRPFRRLKIWRKLA